ncbi:MAG: glycoside hydrolase/phage tail family protein [Marinosulfonomonas sp.]|nr:glycoside hydrolase/phage tail family protein [Marinosulfonomonas sp.]
MATIILSAVGAAAGASVGGGVLGLSSMVIGRAIGATVGRVIDQRLMGAGSEVVSTPRVDRFRLSGAGEGGDIAHIYGRMRMAGQVIWASRFVETVSTSGGGGKGAPATPKVREYSYSVSLAVALCEGEITRIGRVWADGQEIARDDLNMRVYRGREDQIPDPKIEAVEGAGSVPAYRGIAYVVLEDLDLGQFGNRVPQLNFEVMRPAQVNAGDLAVDPANGVQGVALIPGSGEYALATSPVYLDHGVGKVEAANINSPSGKSDFATSYEALTEELPNCGSASLVVSWFGDDLRCDRAEIRPKVEQAQVDGKGMSWSVSGVSRSGAPLVPQIDGRAIYGGTATDQSLVEAIKEMAAGGTSVVFYPFILMDQLAGNGLTDPWSEAADQPALPWRGRITLSGAPAQAGSPDQTAGAEAEVAAFFGSAQVGDFTSGPDTVGYSGPAEWSYRRFILHYAHLCALAGGVEAFCIGSEMRGLTQVRGASGNFPAVEALVQLAADVRVILGAGTKIGYAADWSEYFGYHPQDGSGDVLFHLDGLWSDPEIDFVGIDNYMPMSDWRDGTTHADAHWGAIYNTEYLKSNIAGGEGFDWYYANPQAEAFQLRSPITDGAHGEPWVYRYKDIRSWWSNAHHERIGGVRSPNPTAWLPESKPIWFMEIGCAAIDKGTNQPNRFLDVKSSESGLPKYSDGRRDDLMQMQYLRAMFEFWGDGANNPVSGVYGAPMVDTSRTHVWAWDVRPYPFFPHISDRWSDAENYFRGHWLNGRTTARALADVVGEICVRSGVSDIDVSALYGYLRGYVVSDVDGARAALQPLMLAFGFEAVERDGRLIFRNRTGIADVSVGPDTLAWLEEQDSPVEKARVPEAETVGRVRLHFLDADGDYDARSEEAVFPDETSELVSQTEFPLLLTRNEARATTERWLSESRVARDSVRFSLPLSEIETGAGDVVSWDDGEETALYRIDRVTQSNAQMVEAVRVEPEIYQASDSADLVSEPRPFAAPIPIYSLFMDLPLLRGDEAEHEPHIAVTADPWPGSVAVYSSASDSGYVLNKVIAAQSTLGETLTTLAPARHGVLDRGPALRVKLGSGALSSASLADVLNGSNIAAIGDGSAANWEVFQFTDVVLVSEGVYDISGRIRGQAGTDALPAAAWPAGSQFVLLDGTQTQLDVALAERGLARHYRIGPASRTYDDPSFSHAVEAFDGIGLRPLAPVHLRAPLDGAGTRGVRWVRRTRIDGDSWQSVEVPLGEDSESYLVRVVQGGSILREVTTATPAWDYTAAMRASDGISGPYTIDIAQVSSRFGAGLFRRIDLDD